MRRSLLNTLRCPYSGTPLRLVQSIEERDDRVEYGIASSEAAQFPVVAGVLRLLMDEARAVIVRRMATGDSDGALTAALDFPYHERGGAARNLIARVAYRSGRQSLLRATELMKRRLRQVMTNPALGFLETARKLGSPAWAEWELSRFSSPAFLPVFPLLHLIRSGAPILDFGSGVGQASFLASKSSPDSPIVCADYSYSALFLARKFFVPHADFVCLDADFPLPFANDFFSTILSSDAFHYIDSKMSLAREFRRTATSGGVILLSHLHNRLAPVQFGRSLSPSGYVRLFSPMQHRIVDAKRLVQNYLQYDRLDLAERPPIESLNEAVDALTLVASDDSTIFRLYDGLWRRHYQNLSRVIVNPVYEVAGRNHAWRLRRRKVRQARTAVDGGHNGLPPRSLSLETRSLSSSDLLNLKHADPSRFAQLMRDFVLIDVPPRYSTAQPHGVHDVQ